MEIPNKRDSKYRVWLISYSYEISGHGRWIEMALTRDHEYSVWLNTDPDRAIKMVTDSEEISRWRDWSLIRELVNLCLTQSWSLRRDYNWSDTVFDWTLFHTGFLKHKDCRWRGMISVTRAVAQRDATVITQWFLQRQFHWNRAKCLRRLELFQHFITFFVPPGKGQKGSQLLLQPIPIYLLELSSSY